MNTFQAAAVTRLYRVIADQIAGRIRAGEFPRGGRLPSERELAEQLQVSRASIPRSPDRAGNRGLCRGARGTGVFVTAARETAAPAAYPAPGQDGIGPFDLLEARMLIEPECAGMAAQHGSPAQIAAIRDAHEGMSLGNSPGRHDREFHNAIAAACGNAAVAASVAHLWELTQTSPVYSRMEDYFVDTKVWAIAHAEHQRILTAIQARDPDPRAACDACPSAGHPGTPAGGLWRRQRCAAMVRGALKSTCTKHCCSGSTRSTPENTGGMRMLARAPHPRRGHLSDPFQPGGSQ